MSLKGLKSLCAGSSNRNLGSKALTDSRAKKRRVNTSKTIYSDDFVAHVKWELMTKPANEVAKQFGLQDAYVRALFNGVLRSKVEPAQSHEIFTLP